MKYTKAQLEKHINTHSERSADDSDAIAVLRSFLRSNGRINTDFSDNDKWPNIDGRFELVPNPVVSRRPNQNFFVQIKGTSNAIIGAKNSFKYRLKDLAFPAFVVSEVTLDPCILFVILNPGKRNSEQVFYKYMSVQFLNTIDFNNESATVEFNDEDEIFNTEESIDNFVKVLTEIVDRHSFVKRLELTEYTRTDVLNLIQTCNEQICEDIGRFDVQNDTRDNVSRRMLTKLDDLCAATLVLNALLKSEMPSLGLSWELALMDIRTKFLGDFLQSLRYIGKRIPEEGQSERLMLKYYDFLWQIRKYLKDNHNISILGNLEKFPLNIDKEDESYYNLVANIIEQVYREPNGLRASRYYVQNKVPFYVGTERYFEVTLQLAGMYATKFNRITVYTKENIFTNYSVQIGYSEADIELWDRPTKIKIVTNWRVSIDPAVLNKFAAILGKELKISSKYGEYVSLMEVLTSSGINLLDLIDMRQENFDAFIEKIYDGKNTAHFKDILHLLKHRYSVKSNLSGRNVIRYVLLRLREETIEAIKLSEYGKPFPNKALLLSSGCIPFDKNPLLYNLPNQHNLPQDALRAVGLARGSDQLPYVRLRNYIESTGEIYIEKSKLFNGEDESGIDAFNKSLSLWDKDHGCEFKEDGELVCIESYERNTIEILQKLIKFSESGNEGQQQVNNKFIKDNIDIFTDDLKLRAIKNAFVESKLLVIYGAAGTGKTTLMNYLSTLMNGRSKLFLSKTHTALENLKRRITAPGPESDFITIDKAKKSEKTLNYDVIFVDECSTIDNRSMKELLNRINETSLLVLAGDIYQIESIEFGNWFFYAKDIIAEKAVVELNSTWRTNDESIKELWNEVRYKGKLMTEKLVIDGPFSEKISKKLFNVGDKDEIVLCLNYDGRYGLNNINTYFQDANTMSEPYTWQEWKYKIGDPVLFNDTKRFPKLYNNLKGRIVDISKEEDSITFTIDVETNLTGLDARGGDYEILEFMETGTRVRFTIYGNHGGVTEEEREEARMQSIVPFQLAYAVSIHKSQGLEYDSVKIVIPNSNSEKITHGIFYTAITRAKKKLKIFWSAETMQKIIEGFNEQENKNVSLDIVKRKLNLSKGN